MQQVPFRLFSEEKNETLEGHIILSNESFYLGVNNEPVIPYDAKGAATFVVAVILVYGLSIVLFICSAAKKKEDGDVNPTDDRQISKYLNKVSDLRETGERENYRKLKRTIIERVASEKEKASLSSSMRSNQVIQCDSPMMDRIIIARDIPTLAVTIDDVQSHGSRNSRKQKTGSGLSSLYLDTENSASESEDSDFYSTSGNRPLVKNQSDSPDIQTITNGFQDISKDWSPASPQRIRAPTLRQMKTMRPPYLPPIEDNSFEIAMSQEKDDPKMIKQDSVVSDVWKPNEDGIPENLDIPQVTVSQVGLPLDHRAMRSSISPRHSPRMSFRSPSPLYRQNASDLEQSDEELLQITVV